MNTKYYTSKEFAYRTVRNYICSQIAFEREKRNAINTENDEGRITFNALSEMIETYFDMLIVLSNNKDKIIK